MVDLATPAAVTPIEVAAEGDDKPRGKASEVEALRRAVMQQFGRPREAVTLDLTRVPLDELLDFRARHAVEYRAYARDLHQVLVRLGPWSVLALGVGLYLVANQLTWSLFGYPVYQMPMGYGFIRALPLFFLGMALA